MSPEKTLLGLGLLIPLAAALAFLPAAPPSRGCHLQGSPPPNRKPSYRTNDMGAGFSRALALGDCESVEVEVNVCRGFCESLAVPVARRTLLPAADDAADAEPSFDPSLPLASFSHCCRIANHTLVHCPSTLPSIGHARVR